MKLLNFLNRHFDDFLLVAGGACLIHATYKINAIAAEYLVGVLLLLCAVLIGMGQKVDPKKGGK